MIIVKLKSGLGNQMFQYAAGRRLALSRGAKFKLDISSYSNDRLRKFALNVFNICGKFAEPQEVNKLAYKNEFVIIRMLRKLQKKNLPRAQTYIKERHFHFDPQILSLNDGVYMDGFWQSEKYFKDTSSTIREEFKFIEDLTGQNRSLADKIASCQSVSLHVRRGDYVTEPLNKHHGTCDLEYYVQAIERIGNAIQSPHFFIFGDDPMWNQENLQVSYPHTYVTHNLSVKAHEDLRLMSLCKHHIIANSSFSWWGAWLGINPEKIVIAPIKWFASTSFNTSDLIPTGWIKI